MNIISELLNYAPWLVAIALIGLAAFLWFSIKKPCPRCGRRGQGEPYKIENGEMEYATAQQIIDKNYAGIKCKNCGHLQNLVQLKKDDPVVKLIHRPEANFRFRPIF